MRFRLTVLTSLLCATLLHATDEPLSVVYERETGQPAFWTETLDVRYTRPTSDHPGERLVSLDVYTPQDLAEDERLPVVLMVHGGSWKSGDKNNKPVVFNKVPYFVREGFVVVSINYGLTPEIKYPRQPQDVADAIAYIWKNAEDFHIDRDEITIMGHSAGAQLVALVATDGQFLLKAGSSTRAIRRVIMLDGISNLVAKIKQDIQDENETNNRDIQAAFGSTRQELEAGSPVYQVKSWLKDYTPPFLLFFRGNEQRARDDAGMITTLRKNGIPAGGIYIGTYSHSAMNVQVGVDNLITPAILAFLRGADPESLSAVHR